MIDKQLKVIKNFVDNEMNDLLANYVPSVDFMSISEKLLNKDMSDINCSLDEAIFMILSIAQYIETDTTMESILSDEVYDKLHELYVDLTGHSITGTNNTSGSNRIIRQHKYPELRGSLSKVHFIYDNEIPKNDSRKSLESWFNTSINKCINDKVPINRIPVSCWLKYDGVSGVFECEGDKIANVLTRKDTDANTGTDVTHIFNNETVRQLFHGTVPENIFELSEYGIKTEMLMKCDDFEKFKKIVSKPPKNHRSAATMIVNTLQDDYDSTWREYLTICPLQISTNEYVEIDYSINGWYYVGKENGRHQYIYSLFADRLLDVDGMLNNFKNTHIDYIKDIADKLRVPIDGVVLTLFDADVAECLGRSDNKNKYQIAYKFPAGIEKTKIVGINFLVGPVNGTITPLAVVEPVKIMGNTITNVSLSNIDKFDRLDIHIGDEVKIKYDIIPTLFKDETCTKGNDKKVVFPTLCPVCGEELDVTTNPDSGNRTVRCINDNCNSKVVGKIYNYCNKMKIENIGMSTIIDLVGLGVLKTIGDLYRLQRYKMDIMKMNGYGEIKYNNIIKSINTRLVVYPHEFLGSIGIPDIGRKVMKKICSNANFNNIINLNDETFGNLIHIDGIGGKIIDKLYNGIAKYQNIIKDVMTYITFKEYEEDTQSSIKVLFSKVRDKELEQIMIEKYNAEIQSSYTKDTNILIVPDLTVSSSKIDKAKKDGKEIISIQEARERFK